MSLALALKTGKAGGELVYQHQAAAARAGLALPADAGGTNAGVPAGTAAPGGESEDED